MNTTPRTLSVLVAAHLRATRELPAERTASRWIGEADAVARDLVVDPPPEPVLVERLRTIESLLARVDEVGHHHADDHLEDAKRLLEILETLES